jgi:hypothetical protein
LKNTKIRTHKEYLAKKPVINSAQLSLSSYFESSHIPFLAKNNKDYINSAQEGEISAALNYLPFF